MADQDNFNSSDVEFEAVPDLFPRAGLKSIKAMEDNVFEDRMSSKKRVKTMQDTRGSPREVYHRAMWRNRFEAYVVMNKIVVDKVKGPSGETVFRFIDTIAKRIKVNAAKQAPQLNTMKRAVDLLVESLTYKHEEYTLTRHWELKINTLLDALADEGRLLRGLWRKKQWLGIVVFEKMARAWMEKGLKEGCLSWDVHISRLLSLTLVVALCARAGDVSLSQGYTTEYMRWEHITLRLNGGHTLDHFEARVEICYEKGKKRETNVNRVVIVKALQDPTLNIICLVKLLLVQALRSGNILDASNLDEALANASRRADQTIQWRYPDRPVLPKLELHKSLSVLLWDEPTTTEQLSQTTQQMGLIAGVLETITTHDLRRGAANDLANGVTISGVANAGVALALGHSRLSLSEDVTDEYVGDTEMDLYESRITNRHDSKKAPMIGNPFKRRKLDLQEIANYARDHGMDTSTQKGLRQVKDQLYALQESEWRAQEKSRPLAQRTKSELNISTSITAQQKQQLKKDQGSSSSTSATGSKRHERDVEESFVDAQLFDSGEHRGDIEEDDDEEDVNMASSAVDEEGVKPLMDLLGGCIGTNAKMKDADQTNEENDMIGLGMLVDNFQTSSQSSSMLLLPTHEFVAALSKINITINHDLQHRYQNDEGLKLVDIPATLFPTGNTRDAPTFFRYKCPKHAGCGYTTHRKSLLKSHVKTCDGTGKRMPNAGKTSTKLNADSEKAVGCTHEGCDESFTDQKQLRAHLFTHSWTPTKCDRQDCLTPNEVFKTRRSYDRHVAGLHKSFEPTTCAYPKCKSEEVFDTRLKISAHLREEHGLTTVKKQKKYMPIPLKDAEVDRPCPIGGTAKCKSSFDTPGALQKHLRSKAHELDREEAYRLAHGLENSDESEGGYDALKPLKAAFR